MVAKFGKLCDTKKIKIYQLHNPLFQQTHLSLLKMIGKFQFVYFSTYFFPLLTIIFLQSFSGYQSCNSCFICHNTQVYLSSQVLKFALSYSDCCVKLASLGINKSIKFIYLAYFNNKAVQDDKSTKSYNTVIN